MNRNIFVPLLFCVVAAFIWIPFDLLRVFYQPLWLDTIFVITITFAFELKWGVLCGILTGIARNTLFFIDWTACLFSLCFIATAAVVFLFMRFFPEELGFTAAGASKKHLYKSSRFNSLISRVVALLLLSFALTVVISVMGGLISALVIIHSPEVQHRATAPVLSNALMANTPQIPLVLQEIASRIPINIIDRLVSVFVGYGLARGIVRLMQLGRKTKPLSTNSANQNG
jgi:hypothetical protein